MSPRESLLDRVVREGAAALRGAGARDLDVLVDHHASAARFEFTTPSGSREYAAVYEELESYGYRSESTGPVVSDSSFLGYPSGTLAALVAEVRAGTAVSRTDPRVSNQDFRALDAARRALGPRALEVLRVAYLDAEWGALDSAVFALTRSTILDAAPEAVASATRLLTDVASGAPFEWAFRRTLDPLGDVS